MCLYLYNRKSKVEISALLNFVFYCNTKLKVRMPRTFALQKQAGSMPTAIFSPDLMLASRQRSWSKMRTRFKMLQHFEDGSMSVRSHNKTKKALHLECFRFVGDPYGNRTHDSALRGLRLSRLTNGP